MKASITRDKIGNITQVAGFPVHPMANIVPLDENLLSLASSIQETGLLHPVVLYKGKIIDGRRRTLACAELGIVPRTNDIGTDKEFTAKEIYNIVIGESTRRNLTSAQRAIIAAKQTMAGNHKLTGFNDARQYAKSIWDISVNSLNFAKWLVKNFPKYADEIFEKGFVQIGNKKWAGVSGLVKFLKTTKPAKNIAGDDAELQIAFSTTQSHIDYLKAARISKDKIVFVLEQTIKGLSDDTN